MNQPSYWRMNVLLVAGLASGLGAQEPPNPGAAEPLTIHLKQRVPVTDSLVRIGDVAVIEGGTTAQRARAAALDLAELNAARSETVVPQDQVMFRLRLAGWEARQFRIAGADQVVVKWGRIPPSAAPPNAEPGAIVPVQFVTPLTAEPPVLIKVREPVRLTTRVGTLKITARGEAMDQGQLGQLIRIRNIDTNRIVMGRVVDRNLVEVDY